MTHQKLNWLGPWRALNNNLQCWYIWINRKWIICFLERHATVWFFFEKRINTHVLFYAGENQEYLPENPPTQNFCGWVTLSLCLFIFGLFVGESFVQFWIEKLEQTSFPHSVSFWLSQTVVDRLRHSGLFSKFNSEYVARIIVWLFAC